MSEESLFIKQYKEYLKSDNFKELCLYKDNGIFLEFKDYKESLDMKLFIKASKSFAKWLGKTYGNRGDLIISDE